MLTWRHLGSLLLPDDKNLGLHNFKAFSPFPAMFSKCFFPMGVLSRHCGREARENNKLFNKEEMFSCNLPTGKCTTFPNCMDLQ